MTLGGLLIGYRRASFTSELFCRGAQLGCAARIADGVDQFVQGARVEWTAGVSFSEQTVINLHSCLRLKSNLAGFANTMARELDMMQWRVEPNPEVRGGSVIMRLR